MLWLNIETAQTFEQLSGDLANRCMAPTPIRIAEAIEQGGRGSSQRNFEMQGEGVVIDSGHETIRTNMEH